ncbi:response regulator [Roseimaritima sediminicola]|uniref:response regulator n=1 Tax=Roseimaritima sediminicola TaxID=2662066 RepID=UPI001387600B|nr:response regulator [Roseimaritima sediminicola]
MELHIDGPNAPRRRGGRILVVDANPLSLIALAGVLDAEGFECICARSHPAALKAIESQSQDLVVCDVGDDPEAALKLIDDIHGQAAGKDLPSVLIAEARWAGLEQKAQGRTAVHCLFKPIDPASLRAVVEQALWMPHLIGTHRRRGSRPSHNGWLTL